MKLSHGRTEKQFNQASVTRQSWELKHLFYQARLYIDHQNVWKYLYLKKKSTLFKITDSLIVFQITRKKIDKN